MEASELLFKTSVELEQLRTDLLFDPDLHQIDTANLATFTALAAIAQMDVAVNMLRAASLQAKREEN